MARPVAVLALAMLAASAHAAVIQSAAFLGSDSGDSMRPDVVAKTLVNVEEEWRKQAAAFAEGSGAAAPAEFAKSCSTVVSAIIQGSGGKRSVAKEYMTNVCGQKVLEGWHKLRCNTLATAITEHAMKADDYANRNALNPASVCTGFWSEFVEAEKTREAEEAKQRAEQEKIRAEEEKKAAEAAAEAKKKAEAEAKAEAERKAKEEARVKQEQKEKQAKVEAEEAKKRAAEAAQRLAEKKAEAEKIAKEAQAKLEEAAKAEKEHEARLAEHKKAEEQLKSASKVESAVNASVNATEAAPAALHPAPKEVAPKAEEKPATKPAAKAVAPAKAVNATKASLLEQDPCAGCDTGLAQAYQSCAMKHGNPCAERNAAGIVTSGPGQKKDVGCCMKKEKHDRCLQCSSMDCAHKTCNVNKKYYSTYTIVGKLDDKKAMKKAGWGK